MNCWDSLININCFIPNKIRLKETPVWVPVISLHPRLQSSAVSKVALCSARLLSHHSHTPSWVCCGLPWWIVRKCYCPMMLKLFSGFHNVCILSMFACIGVLFVWFICIFSGSKFTNYCWASVWRWTDDVFCALSAASQCSVVSCRVRSSVAWDTS